MSMFLADPISTIVFMAYISSLFVSLISLVPPSSRISRLSPAARCSPHNLSYIVMTVISQRVVIVRYNPIVVDGPASV